MLLTTSFPPLAFFHYIRMQRQVSLWHLEVEAGSRWGMSLRGRWIKPGRDRLQDYSKKTRVEVQMWYNGFIRNSSFGFAHVSQVELWWCLLGERTEIRLKFKAWSFGVFSFLKSITVEYWGTHRLINNVCLNRNEMVSLPQINPGATLTPFLSQLFEDWLFGISLEAWLCCVCCEKTLDNICTIPGTLWNSQKYPRVTEVHLNDACKTSLADLLC